MRLHIGVDPGGSGGLACLKDTGELLGVYPMPPTHIETLHILGEWSRLAAGQATGILEGVNAHPKQGVVSVFTFGKSVGALECALDAAGIGYDVVYPIKWQNALECRSGGNKNITKNAAAALFPQLRVTHAIADALLLAEYGRRFHRRT